MYLKKIQQQMKKWADHKYTFCEFKERDQILVEFYRHGRIRGIHKSLIPQYEGQVTILKKVKNIAYKVELFKTLFKLYPIFHVSLVKSFYQERHNPSRNVSTTAPTGMSYEYGKVAKKIMIDRIVLHKT